jgi:hypothetical protein
MKMTVWMATRDRSTWIAGAEALVLALILFAGAGALIRFLVGLPVLAHLGYTAMTSLPIGSIPGRPMGTKQYRRNPDLRSRVGGFLNEVRRVEDYAHRARGAGLPPREVERALAGAHEKIMEAAALVVPAIGRSSSPPPEDLATGRGPRKVLTHAVPSQS